MYPIKEVSDVDLAFPTSVKNMIPLYEDIPEEFKSMNNKWSRIVSYWFFNGLSKNVEFHPKEGVDPEKAFNHIIYVMKSWEPKHEHKTAGVAFLLNEWFEDVKNYEKYDDDVE